MKLLLFDVDGTLVLTAGAAVRAMDEAFHEVFGVAGAFEHIPMPGRTDGAILKDAFTRAIPQSQILADALAATGVHPVDGGDRPLQGGLLQEVRGGNPQACRR